ncbi:unnamed protein product (macronuclear) [Paramecium tetraurelia]|uniref:RRM domain-containing protein n=1 Tax=Paramecium tetraurelia TaxID=5888 RepID=A0DN47_PARTE|nr:uncharacterized protein GSPATT00018669001 [Paramecium tetraurelia]CAK84464.1 unnamed protein product [Paramecium tetraurelia]|eukprot:XP_001451861.1 hypothetical protein (macronuclear) [Paramecium tetraurelia strain d4-2]
MPPKLNQIHVSNIQSQAKNQEVEQLLQTIGPLMEWTPKQNIILILRREGEVKFSCTAEYYDEFTASIAVETLNGYKFQGRELKVKLHGSLTSLKICMISFVLCFFITVPYAIEKVNYKTSSTYNLSLPLDEFYGNLTTKQKVAIIIDLKQTFQNREELLEKLLMENQRMAEFISKIHQDVQKGFKTNYNNDEFHQNSFQHFQNHHRYP